MKEKLKKIMQNKKHRNITIASALCVVFAVSAIWFATAGKPDTDNRAADAGDPVDQVSLEEQQVPLSDMPPLTVAVGDVIVVSVYADEMTDVYGYQFEINYDSEYVEYSKRLYSDIDEILTIFAADKEWYLLVGATMIGDAQGYDGTDVPVCRVEFTALTEFDLNDDFTSDHFAISSVNTVTSDLQYLEDVAGWSASVSPLS